MILYIPFCILHSKLDKISTGLVWPHIWPRFEQQVGFRWYSEINFMNYFDPTSLNLWSKHFALDTYLSYSLAHRQILQIACQKTGKHIASYFWVYQVSSSLSCYNCLCSPIKLICFMLTWQHRFRTSFSLTCSLLILISFNSQLAAKYILVSFYLAEKTK